MTTAIEYTEQQMAANGWAVIDISIAMRLRPSLWGGIGTNAAYDFGQVRHKAENLLEHFPGAKLYQAQVETIGKIKVLARHPQFLVERMSWVLGLEVSDVTELDSRPRIPTDARHEPGTNGKLVLLRITAAQEPPVHDCALRREILAARIELEGRGVGVEAAVS